MFISIIDFDIHETDDSQILITILDTMGKPEDTKIFDKNTNYDNGNWIQVGYFQKPN